MIIKLNLTFTSSFCVTWTRIDTQMAAMTNATMEERFLGNMMSEMDIKMLIIVKMLSETPLAGHTPKSCHKVVTNMFVTTRFVSLLVLDEMIGRIL